MNRLSSLLPSVLLIGLVGYILGTTAPSTPAQSWQATPTPGGTVISPLPQAHFVSHPRDWAQIIEGNNYQVPAGKIFVLTAIGSNQASGNPVSLFNTATGLRVLQALPYLDSATGGHAHSATVFSVPVGYTAPAGTTLTTGGGVALDFTDACAWGYLVDA